MNILNNRKIDNRESRLIEFLRWHALLGSAEELRNIIDRSFEAGVAAKSDADFAAMQDSLDRARARFEAQRQTEPIAFLAVQPGTLIQIATNGL